MIDRLTAMLRLTGGRPMPKMRRSAEGGTGHSPVNSRLSGVAPSRAPGGAHVVVGGGGLAGLAAATVLVERGVKVTVLEKAPQLGGRLAAWGDQLKDGTPLEMERGFHGFFRQYYNLRNLLKRVDPTLSFLTPLTDYPLLGPNGATETFENLPRTPPFNILELVRRSPYLPYKQLKEVAFWPAIAMLSYEEESTYRRYDGVTAKDYLDSLNFTDEARRMLFDVFSHSFFNPEARYSAAELLMNFHFYFLGNPEGLVFDVCNKPFSKAILEPLQRYLEQRGATFVFDAEVTGVEVRGTESGAPSDGVTVATSKASHDADAVVLALSVPALKAVAASSTTLARTMRDHVSTLDVTDPFFIHRMWLDTPVAPNRAAFAGTSGLGLLDNISIYERFEEESRAWAQTTGGSVVELHAYAVPQHRGEASVRSELLETLYALYPETRDANIVEERCFLRQDCPAFGPGGHATRPTVQCAGDRVALAGDAIKCPVPSALMERATTTGMLAANHLLGLWGIEEETLYSVPQRGLLAALWGAAEARGFPIAPTA